MGFQSRRWERWQEGGRLFLLKEEIILCYKITALPLCSFGFAIRLRRSTIPLLDTLQATTTNTNLKAETTNHATPGGIPVISSSIDK